jgi:hypothetical protein
MGSSLMAEARIFDFNSENFAAYFLGSFGTTALGKSAYQGETTGVTYDKGNQYGYSGEFGFLYGSPVLGVRFGFEFLLPEKVTSVAASNGTSTLYNIDSSVIGYVPKIGFEINFKKGPTSRFFLLPEIGYATVSLKNDYTLTSAGQSAYSGVTDHSIEAKGTGVLLAGKVGYEALMTDTTTIMLETGYRHLSVTNMQYTKSVTTFSGAKNSGDSLGRNLDLSGFFISAGFRFFL